MESILNAVALFRLKGPGDFQLTSRTHDGPDREWTGHIKLQEGDTVEVILHKGKAGK